MRIDCVGAGPGNLFFALLAKRRSPASRVRVFEKQRVDDRAGVGVVLDSDIQRLLREADAPLAAQACRSLVHWDTIEVLRGGGRARSGGHAFGCIARSALLRCLRERCAALGVELHENTEIRDPDALNADLVVAADGVHSTIRLTGDFGARIEQGNSRFIWCATPRPFPHFTFAFYAAQAGWFWAQAYQHEAGHSTFIAECEEAAAAACGTGENPGAATASLVQQIFAPVLQGTALHPVGGWRWRRFEHVQCERWYSGRVVLLGDAAHTAHYSLGSGTKLALEDALALATHVFGPGETLPQRLQAYQDERQPRVRGIQLRARRSERWFEQASALAGLDMERFAAAVLMRSSLADVPASPATIDRMLALARRRAGVDSLLARRFGALDVQALEG